MLDTGYIQPERRKVEIKNCFICHDVINKKFTFLIRLYTADIDKIIHICEKCFLDAHQEDCIIFCPNCYKIELIKREIAEKILLENQLLTKNNIEILAISPKHCPKCKDKIQ